MNSKTADHWTIGEKNKLLHLLYSYPYNAYGHLSKKLRSKSPEQVQQFIEKLVSGATHVNKFKTGKDTVHRAPLEEWKEIAADMTSLEKVDSSANLSKVFSVISSFEEFPQGADDPDYKAIYRYLSQCLQNDRKDDVDTLGALESAVVLDLLHSSMTLLGENDLTVQRNVMRWKYLLLDYRDDNAKTSNVMLRKAAQNDFKEFIEDLYSQDAGKKGVQGATGKLPGLPTPVKICQDTTKLLVADSLGKTPEQLPTAHSSMGPSGSNTAISSPPNSTQRQFPLKTATVSTAPDESADNTSVDRTEVAYKKPVQVSTLPCSSTATSMEGSELQSVTGQPSSTVDSNPSQSTTGTETDRLVEKLSSAEPYMEDSTLKHRHKRGRKGIRDVPETPITEIFLVMPPEGKEIINYTPRKKGPWRNQHFEGKYQSIDPESEIITNDLSRDYFYEVHRTESDQFYTEAEKTEARRKAKVLKLSKTAHKVQRSIEEGHKRKYEHLMRSVKNPNAPVKKPKLYTINPFCLPVSLIDLDS